MKDFTDVELKNRYSIFRKVDWKRNGYTQTEGKPLQQRKKAAKAKKNAQPQVNFSSGELQPIVLSIGMEPDPTPTNFFRFNNKSLEDLSIDGPQNFLDDHWVCTVKYENAGVGRIYIEDVGVKQDMGDHIHTHPVFKSIHFKNVVIGFDIEGTTVNMNLDIDSSAIVPAAVREYFGYLGTYNGNTEYQAGVSQQNTYIFYCADTVVTVMVEYSFVFMYPKNDFDPTGLIDASKIYPQVNFIYRKERMANASSLASIPNTFAITIPPGKDGNKVKVKNLYARTKLTCNNNGSHHLMAVDANGYDADYFGTMRAGNHMPLMFEKRFDMTKEFHNFVGFYTDSNSGSMDSSGNDDDRDRPGFQIRGSKVWGTGFQQPAPFWNNIFDYGSYNHVQVMEFTGVNKNMDANRKLISLYPWMGGEKSITVHKKPRQGAFDNIHLHGYFGVYQDNFQQVVHAPICGYCCFHMHWRWSALNHTIANSFALAAGADKYRESFRRFNYITSVKFLGWGKSMISGVEEPFTLGGAPLIPSDQELKVAVTPDSFTPGTQTGEVVPANSSVALSDTEKTIWYSVKIENDFGSTGMHLSLEQGCGYAFRYSEDGEAVKNISTLGRTFPSSYRELLEDPDTEIFDNFDATFLNYLFDKTLKKTSLSTTEYFEMQYRFMRYFNEDGGTDMPLRRNINQVPAVNWAASGVDPNSPANTGALLQALKDL